jgi:hypothetical protein
MALSSDGRSIMDSARAALGPSSADRARLRVALASRLAASAAATASTAAAKPLLGLLSSKLMLAIGSGFAIALCGSLGYVWLKSPPTRQVAARVGAPPARPSPSPPLRGSASSPELEPVAPSSSGVAPAARAGLPGSLRRMAKTSPSSSGELAPDVEGEVALLAEAQKALAAGQPARALHFLDEHASAYPRGALGPERAVARVIALCKLGNFAAAQRDAAAFLRDAPTSPVSERIRAACGEAVVQSPP